VQARACRALAVGIDCSVTDRQSRSRLARIAVIFQGGGRPHEHKAHYAHSGTCSTSAPGASARRTRIAPELIFLSFAGETAKMREDKKRNTGNFLCIAMCFVLLFGAARFFYSITKSSNALSRPAYSEGVYHRMLVAQQNNTSIKRSWGPLFVIIMKGIKTFVFPDYVSFAWRMLLLIAYGVIIYFLVSLMSDFKAVLNPTTSNLWSFIFIFLALQFSPAIYNITNGGGEVLTALSIVGQFYYFYKRKYFLAVIFIVCGIYFKLFPVIFAFPYFVFSICSKGHRRYAFWLVLVGAVISVVSLFARGWRDDLLYPLSMVFSIGKQPSDMVLIWSMEIFSPISFINKIINGFQASTSPNVHMSHSVSQIAFLFVILLFGANILAGFKLSRLENRWRHHDQLRYLHLFVFQVVVGFIFLTFSLDISMEHLLLAMVSLFSPIFLFSSRVHKVSEMNRSQIQYIVCFLVGLAFVGGLLPLSILNSILPLDGIHQMAGNLPNNLNLYEKYIWYHVPMFGIYIIALVSYFSARSLINDMNKVA
jgi:hypothetical protein